MMPSPAARLTAGLAFAVALALPTTAVAGPPLLCHPFDIGEAASLPWSGSHWRDSSPQYEISRLTIDTLALLTPTTPVIVRMETLRRAAIYATRDERVARDLLSRLMDRVRAAEASGKADAMALFDAGYLAETFKQTSVHVGGLAAVADSIDGYELVKRSLAIRGIDPTIEFAAALMTAGPSRKAAHAEHKRKAQAGAVADALLARNLRSHLAG
jgi:hypothetical protein